MTSPFLGHASFGLRWGQALIPKWDTGLSLESITIPDSVTSIGSDAFNWCTSLASVNYNGSEGEWNKIKFGSGSSTGLKGKTIVGRNRAVWKHTGN